MKKIMAFNGNSKRISGRIARALSVTLIITNAMLLSSCGKEAVPELLSSHTDLAVYYTVVKGDIEDDSVYDATLVPEYESVYSEISGYVYNVNYKVGDSVKKGEVVFSIYEGLDEKLEELEAELSQYETISGYYIEQHAAELKQMNSYKAGLSGMEADLYDIDIQAKTLEYENAEAQREAEYASMTAEYDELLGYADKCDIYAPCDGIITELSVSQDGDYVGAGANVLTVADASEKILQFEYQTSEELAALEEIYVQIGSDKYYDLDFLEYTEEEIKYLDEYKKTYYSRAIIAGLPDDVSFGDYAAVFEKKNSKSDCIYVPSECLNEDSLTGEYYVKLLGEDDKSGFEETVYVTVGATAGNNVEILEGLSEGDRVYYCEDSTSWYGTASTATAYTGDYSHTMQFSSAYVKAATNTYITLPFSGTISDVYVLSTINAYVEEGDALFSITPTELNQSTIEKAKNTYSDAEDSYKTNLASYEASIKEKEDIVKNSTDKVEKAIAQYELDKLNAGYDDYVAGLDEKLAKAKATYDMYIQCENGEDIIVYAPASGIYHYVGDTEALVFISANATANATVGYIADVPTSQVYISDYYALTEESGYIRFGNSLTIVSDGNDITGTAVCNSDYDNNKDVTIRLDDDSDISKISASGATINVKDIEINDVTLIDSAYVSSDDDGYYVLVDYNGSVVKKHVQLAGTLPTSADVCWVQSGLEPGDVIIKY